MTDAPASRVRPARRSPSDLSPSRSTARPSIATTDGEPAWLGADRRAALARFEALPIESNMLYTTYVDLRTAVLDAVDAVPATARGRPAPARHRARRRDGRPRLVPRGRVETLALDAAASRAGVTLETLGEFVDDDAAEASGRPTPAPCPRTTSSPS